MKDNIILLDGSAGTALWQMAEQRGIEKVPVWRYNLEHPEIVAELHRRYIEAGSRLIQTNTFSVNSRSVKQSSDYSVSEVVTAAVSIARAAAEGTGTGVYDYNYDSLIVLFQCAGSFLFRIVNPHALQAVYHNK